MKKTSNKASLWRGIMHMGLGTILAQMINILAQPILTRLFSAETLGIYTYLISMATIVIPVASLKLDMLIVSEPDDSEAQYITDLCIIINIVIASLYAGILLIGYFLPQNNIFNKYGCVIFLIPLLVLTNGLRFLFISYNNRYKRYKLISSVAILREWVRAVIQVISGFLRFGTVMLTMGYAVSPLVGLHLQMKDYLKNLRRRNYASVAKMKNILLIKGRRQILYLVPAQFINSFSASLLTISITSLFSANTLGYYSAGTRILDIPIVFITSNVSKVCYQRISEDVANKNPVLKTLTSIIMVLSVVSIGGFGILYLIAPVISKIVLGAGYEVAGYYIRCLCVMYGLRFVATSFAGLYTVFNRQNIELWLNVFLILVAGISYIVSLLNNCNAITYLWMIGSGYAVIYFVMLSGYIYLCYKYDRQLKCAY